MTKPSKQLEKEWNSFKGRLKTELENAKPNEVMAIQQMLHEYREENPGKKVSVDKIAKKYGLNDKTLERLDKLKNKWKQFQKDLNEKAKHSPAKVGALGGRRLIHEWGDLKKAANNDYHFILSNETDAKKRLQESQDYFQNRVFFKIAACNLDKINIPNMNTPAPPINDKIAKEVSAQKARLDQLTGSFGKYSKFEDFAKQRFDLSDSQINGYKQAFELIARHAKEKHVKGELKHLNKLIKKETGYSLGKESLKTMYQEIKKNLQPWQPTHQFPKDSNKAKREIEKQYNERTNPFAKHNTSTGTASLPPKDNTTPESSNQAKKDGMDNTPKPRPK